MWARQRCQNPESADPTGFPRECPRWRTESLHQSQGASWRPQPQRGGVFASDAPNGCRQDGSRPRRPRACGSMWRPAQTEYTGWHHRRRRAQSRWVNRDDSKRCSGYKRGQTTCIVDVKQAVLWLRSKDLSREKYCGVREGTDDDDFEPWVPIECEGLGNAIRKAPCCVPAALPAPVSARA